MTAEKIKTFVVRLTGPETKMDQGGRGDASNPLNPLPVKCPHCSFPDLDFEARPYLIRNRMSASTEIAEALFGNFFVLERVRRILEAVVPSACSFYATADAKTLKPTEWWLAVPVRKIQSRDPLLSPPVCSKCGQPKDGPHQIGDIWKQMAEFDSGGVDIFKTLDWRSRGTVEDDFHFRNENRSGQTGEPPPIPWTRLYPHLKPPSHPERWTRLALERELYFSVRLEQLLKRAKVKGQLRRGICFDDLKPTIGDEVWIQEKLDLLARQRLLDSPSIAAKGKTAQRWFKSFLKRNTAKRKNAADFELIERKYRIALPQDYKEFIRTVGARSFENAEGLKETTTTVLPPAKMDFKNFRRGKNVYTTDNNIEIDGVMFATTDFGDSFLFDVSVNGGDYPTYWFKHEEGLLEPYSSNFAECIKRFALGN
jgi:hypothetical protein